MVFLGRRSRSSSPTPHPRYHSQRICFLRKCPADQRERAFAALEICKRKYRLFDEALIWELRKDSPDA